MKPLPGLTVYRSREKNLSAWLIRSRLSLAIASTSLSAMCFVDRKPKPTGANHNKSITDPLPLRPTLNVKTNWTKQRNDSRKKREENEKKKQNIAKVGGSSETTFSDRQWEAGSVVVLVVPVPETEARLVASGILLLPIKCALCVLFYFILHLPYCNWC